jgi:hypothetical protein
VVQLVVDSGAVLVASSLQDVHSSGSLPLPARP